MGSGRKTARSALGGEFSSCTLSVCAVGPNSTMTNVSASPPLIPDGRISRVRLAAMAFPSRTFPFKPKLKCLPTYAPCLNGLISNSTFLLFPLFLQHSVWPVFLSNARHLPRAHSPRFSAACEVVKPLNWSAFRGIANDGISAKWPDKVLCGTLCLPAISYCGMPRPYA